MCRPAARGLIQERRPAARILSKSAAFAARPRNPGASAEGYPGPSARIPREARFRPVLRQSRAAARRFLRWIPDKVPLRCTFPGTCRLCGTSGGRVSQLCNPQPPSSRPERSGEPGSSSYPVKRGIPGQARDDGESEQITVDNIPISAILRSLFTQEGTLPERSVAGWGGGACAGGVPLRRPGRSPESGLAKRAIPRGAGCELARPGLRRGRVRERRKAWRRRAIPYGPAEGDGERRSGGTCSFRLCGTRDFRPRRITGATPRAGVG